MKDSYKKLLNDLTKFGLLLEPSLQVMENDADRYRTTNELWDDYFKGRKFNTEIPEDEQVTVPIIRHATATQIQMQQEDQTIYYADWDQDWGRGIRGLEDLLLPCEEVHAHQWKAYVGFTESYDYCECGEKRGNDSK